MSEDPCRAQIHTASRPRGTRGSEHGGRFRDASRLGLKGPWQSELSRSFALALSLALSLVLSHGVSQRLVQGYLARKKTPIPIGPP